MKGNELQQLESNINNGAEDPAFTLAGSFGIDTGESIVSAIVNNTVLSKTKATKASSDMLSNNTPGDASPSNYMMPSKKSNNNKNKNDEF